MTKQKTDTPATEPNTEATRLFQVSGNVGYHRDGVSKDWTNGETLWFSQADFDALPDALKAHLVPLDEVEIKKG